MEQLWWAPGVPSGSTHHTNNLSATKSLGNATQGRAQKRVTRPQVGTLFQTPAAKGEWLPELTIACSSTCLKSADEFTLHQLF